MESTDGFPIPQHSVSKIKYSNLKTYTFDLPTHDHAGTHLARGS